MTDAAPEPSRIDEIATRLWEGSLRLSPTTATVYGDDRYDDQLDDPGPVGRAAVRTLFEDASREAQAIPEDGLPVEDRITRDMLRIIAAIVTEADDLAFHEIREVDQIDNPMTGLAQLVAEELDADWNKVRIVAAPVDPARSWRAVKPEERTAMFAEARLQLNIE